MGKSLKNFPLFYRAKTNVFVMCTTPVNKGGLFIIRQNPYEINHIDRCHRLGAAYHSGCSFWHLLFHLHLYFIPDHQEMGHEFVTFIDFMGIFVIIILVILESEVDFL